MLNKKNFMLNCEICDARHIQEEDYSHYEKMVINTELVIVDEVSKSILNRLPVTINQENTIEVPKDIDIEVKSINGSYEITSSTAVAEHSILVVNGSLKIHPKTEAVLNRFEKICVNGDVMCPQSLEGYLSKISINGSLNTFPDDCVLLDDIFVIDKYFPLRAKEGTKYYAKDRVVLSDFNVDVKKLAQKNVSFVTEQLLVPEEKVEDCITMFDERVDFVVIPEGMTLIHDNITLNERFVKKEGSSLYVYGSVTIDPECDLDALSMVLKKLVVKGTVTLQKRQAEAFAGLHAEYDKLELSWEGILVQNKVRVKVDQSLLDHAPEGVRIMNAATIKIAEDVSPSLILNRLSIGNCAKVFCSEEQESAVAAISENVATIGNADDAQMPDFLGLFKDLTSTKMINAEQYVM